MQCPIKLPVYVNDDGALIDAAGKVVANFCWRNEYTHVVQQKEKAQFVAWLLNEMGDEITVDVPEAEAPSLGEPKAGNGHGTEPANKFVVDVAKDITEGLKKRRGNPNWIKGVLKKKKDDDKKA